MQSLSQIGNARREERVLLPALIELRSEQGDEALTADGLDVSPSGVSVRAAFVPEVGTRLMLSFRCPPNDDAVHALGEVVWSAWDGPRIGSFGMRFLELDTKSATAIRRYVAPDATEVDEPELPRVATMRIDGLGAPIEADVRLYDQACIVLEQELSFLRLGRGIEVDLPGRGKERGRIASIELRQGPLDTPTLVFGVLLDEKPDVVVERAAKAERSGERALGGESVHEHEHEHVHVHEGERVAEKRRGDEPRVVRVRPSERVEAPARVVDEDDEFERALQSRAPDVLVTLFKLLSVAFSWLRHTLLPALSAGWGKLRAMFSVSESEGEAAPSRILLSLARARAALGGTFVRVSKGLRRRRRTAPVPRVQRSGASARPQQRAAEQRAAEPAPRNRRWLTVGLAALGIGLGVYALAPRSGADRIRVPRAEPSAVRAEPSLQAQELPLPTVSPISATATTAISALETRPAQHEPAAAKPEAVSEPSRAELPEPGSGSSRFGEPSVPNGRVFVLRMSGPVKGLEGETREDGFSVRIPGRLALDRASPIATSHRSVARALILNRGEYAELTVEFLPGMRPKYQVAAKDNTIEVTLERL